MSISHASLAIYQFILKFVLISGEPTYCLHHIHISLLLLLLLPVFIQICFSSPVTFNQLKTLCLCHHSFINSFIYLSFTHSLQGARHSFTSHAGRNMANPTANLLAAASMLRHIHLERYATLIENAVLKTIKVGKVGVIRPTSRFRSGRGTGDVTGVCSVGMFVLKTIN